MLILFLPKINVAFLVSKAGDKFGSSVFISTDNVSDLFLGKLSNLASSFIFDATNLGVGKNVVWFNTVGSNPWSTNETSVPPELVPVTVLTDAFTRVDLPGVIQFNCGESVLNWWFCEISILEPPNAFSLVNDNCCNPVVKVLVASLNSDLFTSI